MMVVQLLPVEEHMEVLRMVPRLQKIYAWLMTVILSQSFDSYGDGICCGIWQWILFLDQMVVLCLPAVVVLEVARLLISAIGGGGPDTSPPSSTDQFDCK